MVTKKDAEISVRLAAIPEHLRDVLLEIVHAIPDEDRIIEEVVQATDVPQGERRCDKCKMYTEVKE